MRIKVSEYIAKTLVNHGITQVFSVTGGGAMHLNDALGHQEGLKVFYNHHEQASAIAAESYARIENRIAALCVTTGPGGTNAITGVVGGWLDSIPMLVLSGQVRSDMTARLSGVGIRAMGDQEFDICKSIDCMTKYSEMILNPLRIRYCLEKAIYLSYVGRPGPTWLDIPLDIQSAYVEEDELIGFDHLMGMHLNDSKPDLGTRVDRHDSLGKGKIGLDAFRFLMNDERIDDIPMVLETIDETIWKEEIAL